MPTPAISTNLNTLSSIMAPSLEKIPNELKELVFGYLLPASFVQGTQISNMLAMRTTNKYWHAYFAAPFESIFEVIHTTCLEKSPRRFVSIAQHGAVNHLVRIVVISTAVPNQGVR